MAVKGSIAVAGLGITEMGKVYGRTATGFAAEAIGLALDDAGLGKNDLDGLLINGEPLAGDEPAAADVARASTTCAPQHHERVRLHGGDDAPVRDDGHRGRPVASCVACVYADAPLKPKGSAGAAYGAAPPASTGMDSLRAANGDYGPTPGYALAPGATCTSTAPRASSSARSPSASASGRMKNP